MTEREEAEREYRKALRDKQVGQWRLQEAHASTMRYAADLAQIEADVLGAQLRFDNSMRNPPASPPPVAGGEFNSFSQGSSETLDTTLPEAVERAEEDWLEHRAGHIRAAPAAKVDVRFDSGAEVFGVEAFTVDWDVPANEGYATVTHWRFAKPTPEASGNPAAEPERDVVRIEFEDLDAIAQAEAAINLPDEPHPETEKKLEGCDA